MGIFVNVINSRHYNNRKDNKIEQNGNKTKSAVEVPGPRRSETVLRQNLTLEGINKIHQFYEFGEECNAFIYSLKTRGSDYHSLVYYHPFFFRTVLALSLSFRIPFVTNMRVILDFLCKYEFSGRLNGSWKPSGYPASETKEEVHTSGYSLEDY